MLKKQGVDYNELIPLWKRPINKWTFDTHIVNLCMMLKSEAISYDVLGVEYTDLAECWREILEQYNGTPVGLFTGDECLSGNSPIQGTEFCAVVEQMYSYEILYAYTGDVKWLERLEVLAFNALPATISDDMWAHQYVQMSNQIACQRFPGRSLFRTNNHEAHLFGLEPNYGCCTANFSQGWPKFALAAFMHCEETIISAIPVPAELRTDNIHIKLTSEYPFKNELVYQIESLKDFKFAVRVPDFAIDVKVNGEKVKRADMLNFDIKGNEKVLIHVSFDVKPIMIDRPNNLKTVKYGSLIFSVPIEYERKMYEYEKDGVERKYPYCDYEYIGTSDWNYGYGDEAIRIEERKVSDIPFSSTEPPVVAKVKMAQIDWGLEDGFESVCAKVPQSLTPISDLKEIELYPYGCAKLRMTEIPRVELS
ncbi:MAG: glycoside hydrolase family 127 protein [Lachnospiraceae bacterium]|nr:glycoside hydrolase family 127 protein [Lachnospiraceae bacterium]